MLVLTRTQEESILIYPGDIPEGMTVEELFADGPIEIKVMETRPKQCKLGIDAPEKLKILRDDAKARD